MSDFIIQQGTDAGFTWPITNDDGTTFNAAGWQAKMEVRSRTGTLLHTFSTTDGNLHFGSGTIVATWTAVDSSTWTWSGGSYDLYIYSNSQKLRVDKGYVSVSKTVTVL